MKDVLPDGSVQASLLIWRKIILEMDDSTRYQISVGSNAPVAPILTKALTALLTLTYTVKRKQQKQ